MATLFDIACEIAFEPDPGSAYLHHTYEGDMSAGDPFLYHDMTSVTDYVLQAGDVLEYDVWWETSNARISFDVETADASWALRGAGAVDQNGAGAHPGTPLLDSLVLGMWYSRRIAIPASGVGKTITKFMLANHGPAAAPPRLGRLRDIRITDGAGTVRKNIWRQVTVLPTLAVVYNSGGASYTLALAKRSEDPVWTDVTPDFLEAHPRRGRRPSLLATADQGGGTVTLDNGRRDYDPTNTSGPYYGKIKPGRRIRVRLRRYWESVKADAPSSLWRLAETVSSATLVKDEMGAANGGTGTGGAHPSFGQPALLIGEDETVYGFDGGDVVTFGDVYDFTNRQPFTIEAWLELVTHDGTARAIFAKLDDSGGSIQGWVLFNRNTEGIAFRRYRDGAFTEVNWAAAVAGTTYHVVVDYDGSTLRLYVANVLRDSAADAANLLGHAEPLNMGGFGLGVTGFSSSNVFLGEAAIWDGRVLSDVARHSHYERGINAWYGDRLSGRIADWLPRYRGRGSEVDLPVVDSFERLEAAKISGFRAAELPGARIAWVLDQISYADRGVIDAGNTTVQESSSAAGTLLDNDSALGHLLDVGDAELGLVFANASDKLTFHDRRRRITTQATSLATFSDEPTGDELLYIALEPSFGNEDIKNEVRTRPKGGATDGVAEDLGSQARYDKRTESREPWIQTLVEAQAQSEYLLSQLREPGIRFRQITIDPKRDPARLIEQAVKREISDRITVEWRPYKPAADVFGVVSPNLEDKLAADRNAEIDSLAAMGARWLRLDLKWSRVQEAGQGTFDWSDYDPIVSRATEKGLRIVFGLNYTPAFARPGGTDDKYGPDTAQRRTWYGDFCAAAVARYSPMVRHWEIWNEPNSDQFWKPAPSVANYVALLQEAYARIKAVDPGATVIAGSTAPIPPASAPDIDEVAFIQDCYTAGAAGDFDAWSHHPYTEFPDSTDPDDPWRQLATTTPSVRSVMAANGDAAKKLWGTETGAGSTGAQTEATQAEILRTLYSRWQTYAWAGPLFWFMGRDDPAVGGGFDDYGLLRNNFTQKPAWSTYEDVINPVTTRQVHIESVADDIVARDGRWSWLVHYELTPADVQAYWVLGDATLSLLGQSTILGY